MRGHQNDLAVLRAAIARHISKQSESAGLSNKNADALRQSAAHVATNGTSATDDVILAAANCLQQMILVYVAINSLFLLAYSPSQVSLERPLLCLTFFEPGHYTVVKAEYKSTSANNSNRNSGHDNNIHKITGNF